MRHEKHRTSEPVAPFITEDLTAMAANAASDEPLPPHGHRSSEATPATTEETMTPDEKWERRRAVTAFLDIAIEALAAACAVSPEGRVILTDKIHEAKVAASQAKQRAEIDLT